MQDYGPLDFQVESVAADPTGYYVVRCYECGHLMGQTDDPNDTSDICERCEQ